MGAEVFDVEVALDAVDRNTGSSLAQKILYATKLDFKRNKDNNTTLTFNGDVTTGAANTGATISLEGLVFPANVDEARQLEDILIDGHILTITCSGTSYTQAGDPYRRIIIGNGVTITSDEESWAPSDGISSKLELSVDNFTKSSESI